MKYRCQLPLYRGWVPGWLPLIMEVDNTIVAFVDIFFKFGSEFSRFNIEPTDTAMNASIGVLDKYQGLGYGTAYSYLTDCIGRYYNIDFILGGTYFKDGMYGIRAKDGWEVIRRYRATSGDEMVDHKKQLK